MEEPTKYTRKPIQAPGRRYVAGRISPRAGADISSPTAHHSSPVKVVEPTLPKPIKKTPIKRNPATAPALPRTKRSQVLRRQMVERAAEQRHKVKKKRSLHFLWYGFALFVFAMFLIVVLSFRESLPFHLKFFESTPQPVAINSIDSDPQETSVLDEADVSEADIALHVVSPDVPRVLRIPKLNLAARIRQVGSTLNNEPISPKNTSDVGWYESSSKLGDEGAALLNGHLQGPTRPGIFRNIQTLEAGDKITVERGDGKIFTYVVSRTQTYSGGQIDMSAAINSIEPSKPGLNLLTTLNKYSGTDKRVLIFAVL